MRLPRLFQFLLCTLACCPGGLSQPVDNGENANWRNSFNAIGPGILPLASAFSGTDYFVGGEEGIRRWDGVSWHAELADGEAPNVRVFASSTFGLLAAGTLKEGEDFVFRREGTNWVRLGAAFDRPIYGLAASGTNIYAGGDFRAAGTNVVNHIARWSGTNWQGLSFAGTNGLNETVTALFTDGAGELYASGYFTAAGLTPLANIARWNGQEWSSLGAGLSYQNEFTTSNVPANAITRWHGDIYVTGRFVRAGTTPASRIARWDGSEWHAVGAGLGNGNDSSIQGIALAADDSALYVAGSFYEIGGKPLRSLARWNGAAWSSVYDSGDQALQVSTIALKEGALYIGAAAIQNGAMRSLGSEIQGPVQSVVEAGGAIYLGGEFVRVNFENAGGIARFTPSLPASDFFTFGGGVSGGAVRSIAVAPDGSVFAGGTFTSAGGRPITGLARWTDSHWEEVGGGLGGPSPRVFATLWHEGRLYVGGAFTRAGNIGATNLAVWDGSAWSALGNPLLPVYALAWHQGHLFAGGDFTQIGNVPAANRVAEYDPVSKRWSDLGTGFGSADPLASPRVNVLRSQGSRLVVGGRFSLAGNKRINSIALWDGASWHALGTGPLNGVLREVSSLFVRGKELYVGGDIVKQLDDHDYSSLLHWDGSRWSHLGTVFRAPVRGLAAAGTDLYAGSDSWPPGLNVWRMPVLALNLSTNEIHALAGVDLSFNAGNFFGPVTNAAIYQNSNLLAVVTLPGTCQWTNIPAGEYQVTAATTNLNGDRIESLPLLLNVAQPENNLPPAALVDSPANGAVFTSEQSIEFRARASDADGTVDRLEVVTDYGFTLPERTTLPPGQYSVRARAIDNRGGTAFSPPVSFKVVPPNVPPSVLIQQPFNRELITSTNLPVRVEASDSDGFVSSVVVSLSGTSLSLAPTNGIYSGVITNVPGGNQTLTAVATDNQGAVSEFQVRVNVLRDSMEPESDVLPSTNAFVGGWVTDGPIYTMLQTNGTLFLGGDFQNIAQQIPGSSVIELSSETPDLSYPAVDGPVNTIVPDGAGGYYLGGLFNSVGGIAVRNAAHVRADKSVDAAWNPNPNWHVIAIAVDADKLFLGGEFTEIGGEPRRYLAAVRREDGRLTDGNPVLDGWVSALALRGGSLFVGGNFRTVSGQARAYLAALSTTNAAVLPWRGTANDWVSKLVAVSDRVYAAGVFNRLNDVERDGLGAFDAETGELLPWNPWVQGRVSDLFISSGKMYLAGGFFRVGGVDRANLAAVDERSGALLSWNPGADHEVSSMVGVSNTVYVSGQFGSFGQPPIERTRIAALDAETGEVLPFNLNTTGVLGSMAVIEGRALGAGSLGQLRIPRNGLAAFDARSGYARAWDPKCAGPVYALAYADGALYVGGEFHEIAGAPRSFAAALNPGDASLLPWQPNTSGGVHALAIAPGSPLVYLGGTFQTIGGKPRRYIGAVDARTGEAAAWNVIVDGPIKRLLLDRDQLYLAGAFQTVGGELRRGLARVNAATGLLDPFDPDPQPGAVSRMIDAGETIFVSGGFTSIGGKDRSTVAELDKRTGKATGWRIDASASSIALLNDTLLVGGQFTAIDGQARTNIAAIDLRKRTNYVLPWALKIGTQTGLSSTITLISPSLDSIFVAGDFDQVDGEKRPYVAGFPFPTALQPLASVPHGLFQIRLIGPLGRTYVFEASPDLREWTPVMTNRAPFLFEDLEAVNQPKRFYRALPR